jgi:hypothetical protein
VVGAACKAPRSPLLSSKIASTKARFYRLGIEAGDWFIGEQHAALLRECPRDRDTPLLTPQPRSARW